MSTVTRMTRGVFAFDHDHGVAARDLVDLLGGKGAGLAEMTALGLAVPPGFTIGLPVFRNWRHGGWSPSLDSVVASQVAALGRRMGRTFGDAADPLLLSVRSGAAVSMPGMLDTVLDLGLNDDTVRGLAAATGDAGFAHDSHARFVRMFGTIVMGVPADALPARREHHDAGTVARLRSAVERAAGRPVPDDPTEQLRQSVAAVFASWDSDRARAYRDREGIDPDAGTAVNVQAMVFGNRGERSGTGVVFTRDPNTGDPAPYGDYLPGGQGEDVVDGSSHPVPIGELATIDPRVHAELLAVLTCLERHYGHVCDVEFTVEDGRLWLLQTRAGKLGAVAAVRAAVDLADDPEVALTRDEALARVPAATRDRARADLTGAGRASRPTATDATDATDPVGNPVVTGLGASAGRATGAAVFSSDAALEADGDVVLVRPETSPADVVGMSTAVAILTSRGGLASHAAVVARGWGLPAVVGAVGLDVGPDGASGPDGLVIRPGDRITVDGTTGAVWLGDGPDAATSPAESAANAPAVAALERLEAWQTEHDTAGAIVR
jgi:pyruvate, orthophosphate dikinase